MGGLSQSKQPELYKEDEQWGDGANDEVLVGPKLKSSLVLCSNNGLRRLRLAALLRSFALRLFPDEEALGRLELEKTRIKGETEDNYWDKALVVINKYSFLASSVF